MTELAGAVAKAKGRKQLAVYVYDMPVRLWHWVNALLLVVLGITGYFIGDPPPTIAGDTSETFLFGYIRLVHFAAGQILALSFLLRIVWAFIGNSHSRQLFTLPLTNVQWWKEVIFELKWYMFLERDPNKYIGHNPLAQLSMFAGFVIPMVVVIFTGMALYAEGQGIESWQFAMFGWVIAMVGDSFTVHTIHHLAMWVLVIFAMIHIYAAIREDIMSRQSMVSTMISGWRMFKDDRP